MLGPRAVFIITYEWDGCSDASADVFFLQVSYRPAGPWAAGGFDCFCFEGWRRKCFAKPSAGCNKAALLGALGKYDITNERLDEGSDYYRYVRSQSNWRSAGTLRAPGRWWTSPCHNNHFPRSHPVSVQLCFARRFSRWRVRHQDQTGSTQKTLSQMRWWVSILMVRKNWLLWKNCPEAETLTVVAWMAVSP